MVRKVVIPTKDYHQGVMEVWVTIFTLLFALLGNWGYCYFQKYMPD